MLTPRTLLLTAFALLAGFAASAQPTAAAAPGPTDILGWVAGAVALVVLVLGLITGISMAATAAASYQPEAVTVLEEAPALSEAAPTVQAAPAVAPVFTAEPVAA